MKTNLCNVFMKKVLNIFISIVYEDMALRQQVHVSPKIKVHLQRPLQLDVVS